MNYEVILSEMQEQIRALEKQVELLSQELSATKTTMVKDKVTPLPVIELKPKRKNGKVNEKMLDACYKAAKEFSSDDNWSVPRLADKVQSKTGMNRNNAFMTILVAYALLNGEVYKRTVSGNATEYFFGKILQEHGKSGLAQAVGATRKHIDYRRALHHNVDKLEQLCEQYEKQL